MRFILIIFLLSSCATEDVLQRVQRTTQEILDRAIEGDKTSRIKTALIEEKNLPIVILSFKEGARAGKLEDQLRLAYSYAQGLGGVEKDHSKAAYWYKQAAKQKNGAAYYQLGLIAEGGLGQLRDYRKAVQFYKTAIDLSQNTSAIYQLGLLYESGKGVPKNFNLALTNFTLAAEKNYPPALDKLGALYLNGDNVLQNHARALLFFNRAAALGSTDALYNLGIIYLDGRGVEKDISQSYIWFSIAASLGSKTAQEKLKEIESQIPFSDLASLQENAQEWINEQLKLDE